MPSRRRLAAAPPPVPACPGPTRLPAVAAARVRPERRLPGSLAPPTLGDLCTAAVRVLSHAALKPFPPRRDARHENNQRSPSAGALADGKEGIRAEPHAQPLSKPGGPTGWGPGVTQRSRRDKRHPLAPAPIPERPAR